MELVDSLDHAFRHAHGVIAGVSADQYEQTTPCAEWTVRDLLSHLIGVVAGIGKTAAGTPPSMFELGSDPAAQFDVAAAATLAAWQAPGTLDREMKGPGGPMPGRVLASINLLDTATHAWDLARATGQDPTLPDDVALAAMDASRMIVTPELRAGRFAPEVEIADDAAPTDRLVAFLGRRP
jgi:uncharacterized protein (TIGR03086 family)